jgi:phenylpropionate dioxygenase-like ring-hydroxylating dioxygenase large terminal subunit
VAQLDTYKGLLFATFDPTAPPLLEYLAEMTWYLDAFFDRREGGIEVIGGMHKWLMPCNWKFPAENFGGDTYHVQWTHLSAIKTSFSSGVTTKPTTTGSAVSPGNGHVLICLGPKDVGDPPVPEILAYEEAIRPEVEKRLGPRVHRINPIVGTVFPNFSSGESMARGRSPAAKSSSTRTFSWRRTSASSFRRGTSKREARVHIGGTHGGIRKGCQCWRCPTGQDDDSAGQWSVSCAGQRRWNHLCLQRRL